jgi:hypothetical protein
MQLYSLVPIQPWEPWYDKAFGFVIRAASEQDARQMASENAGDEGPDVWLDHTKTTCTLLTTDGEWCVICRDFARA